VSRAEKLLRDMRNNPGGDWQIGQIERLCHAFDLELAAPTRGSHYTVRHASQARILTIPFRRPIKPVYIRELIAFIDAVEDARKEVRDE
jgi:hypothetical protein